jgi:uncharacterized membrane protein (UPF0127 family)
MKKSIIKPALVIVAVFAVLATAGCTATTETKVKGPAVVLNTAKGRTEIAVDIADTSEERARGLMNRKNLAQGAGMFFIFEEEEQRDFWMKNTLIPLDMIFFDKDYRVVGISRNAQPCKADPCPLYSSGKPARFVLEVNGGVADILGLKEGDKADLII